MITRDDLKIVDQYTEDVDNTIWMHVEYDGQRYILTATDVTDEVLDDMHEKDVFAAVGYMMEFYPRFDHGVFRGDENWKIKGECDDRCADGVCTKRIASDQDTRPVSIDHSINMLLRFLNN